MNSSFPAAPEEGSEDTGDGTAAPGGTPPASPPSRVRRAIGSKAGVACAVLIAGLLIVLGVVVVRGSDEPTAEASVPDVLAGTWAGMVSDNFGTNTSRHVEVTLEEGRRVGEVRHQHGLCTGTAVPVAYDGKTLTVKTVFPEEQRNCEADTLTLTPREGDEVRIVYYVTDGVEKATGVLNRP
ncbi:hypothetical protein [Actinomadura sp. WMMB 499]|uniref:hypothetical protein n=1 Tax=Actinomadura sp. WMMB 499 TaxID=1219491 RepID=UPI0012462C9C|nr:hypothetical protein [Actinomadura sp. WMMB 499]QFG20781.1 hypothetical protein F7P10_06105 [Actinomadura sp. WMMB 499]